ncbi:MAG: Abi family protein [Clostridium sp.]|nr:Abi family protein [Clostridium sp.]
MAQNKSNDKPFLSYQEQINKLKNEKKLQIPDESRAIALLKRHSYFALVSGYKKPFKRKDGTYQLHTTLDDIYALYSFDNALRNVIFSKILIVEKHVKSVLSYSFCEEYGSSQQAYLNPNNYHFVPENQCGIRKLVAKLTGIADDPKDYRYIQYQKNVYHNIPLWVMVKALPMGSISKMYSYLPPQIQSRISMEFTAVNEEELSRMLDLLSRVRNVCAHNERLYDYRYQRGAIKDSSVHRILDLPKKVNAYQLGKSDLFAVMICLKYLLDTEEISELTTEIRTLLDTLYASTKQINAAQMRKYMGFPENWEEIAICPIL